MDKIRINIADCKEGDLIVEEIVDRYGTIILAKDTVVNSYIKKRLAEMGIEHILVSKSFEKAANRKFISQKQSGRFTNNYKQNFMLLKEVVNDIAAGKILNLEKAKRISKTFYSQVNRNSLVTGFLNALKEIDEYTYLHSLNVPFYSMLIAMWLRLSQRDIKDIIQAGILHDIGKLAIPVNILNKKGRLLPLELKKIKTHTIYGVKITNKIKGVSEKVKEAVLMHHERIDGSGYPFGLKGNEISLYSKIIAVADVYDAMTSDRVYKKKMTPFDAFKMFKTEGLLYFDKDVVNKLLTNLASFYIGAKVLLNTGTVGEIVYIPPNNVTKPVVRVNSSHLDLSLKKDIKIMEML